MKVKCDNVQEGCDWIGTVKSMQKHTNQCGFSLFVCPNKCQADGKVTLVMNEHEERCPKKIINCPQQGCFESMERKKLSSHMDSNCKFTKVVCKYKDFGCNVCKVRMFMKKHEDDLNLHLDLAQKKIITLEEKVSSMVEETVTVLDERGSFTFRLQNFNSIHKNDEKFSSKPFYTRSGGYKMLIRVHTNGYDDAKGTHISIYAKLIEGRNDSALSWPFLGTVTFELLNQQEDSHHHLRELLFEKSDNACVNSGWGHTKFIPHSMLAETSTIKYLFRNALFFRISVREENDFKPWLECPCSL